MHASTIEKVSQQTVDAFALAAEYKQDAQLMRLAENGMRPLSVGNGCDWITGTPAGHGRPTEQQPCEPCVIKPPRCDCHVLGSNTLGTPGIPTGAINLRFGTLAVDSGDAGFFVPYYIFVTAFQVLQNNIITGVPVMVLLQNSLSGREPNMRRASDNNPSFGVATLVYGREKELECVDWRRFASVNNQQLLLTFYNPQAFAVHVFVVIWGIPGAG